LNVAGATQSGAAIFSRHLSSKKTSLQKINLRPYSPRQHKNGPHTYIARTNDSEASADECASIRPPVLSHTTELSVGSFAPSPFPRAGTPAMLCVWNFLGLALPAPRAHRGASRGGNWSRVRSIRLIAAKSCSRSRAGQRKYAAALKESAEFLAGRVGRLSVRGVRPARPTPTIPHAIFNRCLPGDPQWLRESEARCVRRLGPSTPCCAFSFCLILLAFSCQPARKTRRRLAGRAARAPSMSSTSSQTVAGLRIIGERPEPIPRHIKPRSAANLLKSTSRTDRR